jgi:ArsR family transcriptional regulator, arsenate/arsenite/antimonite-responsive transcriptional repressor
MNDYKETAMGVQKTKATPKCCGPNDAALHPKDAAKELASLAWALAHPARAQIVQLLVSREACVCGEIVDQLPLAQSTVSQHLKILKEAGLVQGEVDGPKVCYCINQAKLKQLKNLVAKL